MNEQPEHALPQTREELREGFLQVVRRFREPLILFLRRYVCQEQVAEDLSQESFVKAYFQLDQFDERRPFAPWLFAIAANHARDYLRKSKRFLPAQDDAHTELFIDATTPDLLITREETSEALNCARAKLPDSLREPVLLHYQLDWPVAQIAEHLGISPSAVKTRLHRARVELQKLLPTL